MALLERVRTALGRIAQFELANLKRTFKNDGMNEAAIHAIIPDRPVAKKAVPAVVVPTAKKVEAVVPEAAKKVDAVVPEAGAPPAAAATDPIVPK